METKKLVVTLNGLLAAVALSHAAHALNPQPIPPGRGAAVALNPQPIPPGRAASTRSELRLPTLPERARIGRATGVSPQIDPPPVLRRVRMYRAGYAATPQIDPAP